MAFKLTKTESAQRAQLAAELSALADSVREAITAFNDARNAAFEKVTEAAERYNEKLDEARTFTEEITTSRRDEFDNRSEKWQEGERGEAASGWLEAWDSPELEDIEVEKPEDVELVLEHADELTSLPEEAS